jgi:hypothetical protein
VQPPLSLILIEATRVSGCGGQLRPAASRRAAGAAASGWCQCQPGAMTLGQLGPAASRRTSRARPGGGQRCWGVRGRPGAGRASMRLGWAAAGGGRPGESEAAIGHGPAEAEQGGGWGWLSRASKVGPGGGGYQRRSGRLEEPSVGWCTVGRRRRRRLARPRR